jgi:hypothetical protein
MRRSTALILSGFTILLGLSLMVMGIMHDRFSMELYSPVIVITLAWVFVTFLLISCVVSRFVEDDYEPVFATMFMMLSIMALMIGAFFSYIWLMVSAYTYNVLIEVMLICYGLAVMMVGIANHLLSQQAYRPFIYDFFQELPHIYQRYRI